jgi:hypothetical protein
VARIRTILRPGLSRGLLPCCCCETQEHYAAATVKHTAHNLRCCCCSTQSVAPVVASIVLTFTKRAHSPDPQAQEPLSPKISPWTEVWPTQPVVTLPVSSGWCLHVAARARRCGRSCEHVFEDRPAEAGAAV